jgi:hypothetical protein
MQVRLPKAARPEIRRIFFPNRVVKAVLKNVSRPESDKVCQDL